MQDTAAVNSWLNGLFTPDPILSAQVGGRLYAELAPQGAVLPFVLWQQQGGSDEAVLDGAGRICATEWLIRAVGRDGALSSLRTIADRIDVLMSGASGGVTGWVMRAKRVRPVQIVEPFDGARWLHLGAVWRIWTSEA